MMRTIVVGVALLPSPPAHLLRTGAPITARRSMPRLRRRLQLVSLLNAMRRTHGNVGAGCGRDRRTPECRLQT